MPGNIGFGQVHPETTNWQLADSKGLIVCWNFWKNHELRNVEATLNEVCGSMSNKG